MPKPTRSPSWLSFAASLLTDWRAFPTLTLLLLSFEALVGVGLIAMRRYVNIDWQAYMEQVSLWQGAGGTGYQFDYAHLRGGTGPLVYPAGFLYLFSALQWAGGSSGGAALQGRGLYTVQGLYLLAYLATLYLSLALLQRVLRGTPSRPWVALLLVLSYRLHSLYLLRLFNDCWSALLTCAAVALLSQRHWLAGTLLWSLGVGVKMHGLLLLPALGLVLLRNTGAARTAAYLLAAGALQLALGAPFLAAPAPAPQHYLSRAFQLGRESRLGDAEGDRTSGYFLHTWSVNWGFLPTAAFTAPAFAHCLLAAHLATLLLLAHTQWCGEAGLAGTLVAAAQAAVRWQQAPAAAAAAAASAEELAATPAGAARRRRSASASASAALAAAPRRPLLPSSPSLPCWHQGAFTDSPAAIALALLTCNFVGIAFARSLHYQFYAWYAASLPVLAWGGAPRLPTALRLLALAAIEAGFSYGPYLGTCLVPGVAPADCAPWQPSLLVAGGHALLLAGIVAGGAR